MSKNRFALVLASYQYDDTGLRRLVAPTHDAEALARVLKDPNIGGFDVQVHINEPSHKVNRAIEAFFEDRGRDDLLLLYFSGHGVKDQAGRLYFATPDTRRRRLRTTAIPATLVNDVMQYSRSRKQVLLLDCCFSGAFAKGYVSKGEAVGTADQLGGRGRVVLTASDAIQYAFEGDAIKGEGIQSVFTEALVMGLETGQADLKEDGNITIDELYDYVYDRVRDRTPQQIPQKWAMGVQGNLVFAKNPHPVIKPVTLPEGLQQALESPFAGVREGATRELGKLLDGVNRGLAETARLALERLQDDDSRQVSSEARRVLEAMGAEQAETPAALPIPAEKKPVQREAPVQKIRTEPPVRQQRPATSPPAQKTLPSTFWQSLPRWACLGGAGALFCGLVFGIGLLANAVFGGGAGGKTPVAVVTTAPRLVDTDAPTSSHTPSPSPTPETPTPTYTPLPSLTPSQVATATNTPRPATPTETEISPQSATETAVAATAFPVVSYLLDGGYVSSEIGHVEWTLSSHTVEHDKDNGSRVRPLTTSSTETFIVKTDIIWDSNTEKAGCGFVFHVGNGSDVATIFRDGTYILSYDVDEDRERFQGDAPNLKTASGSQNTLMLIVAGPNAELYVNGNLVAQGSNATKRAGYVAPYASGRISCTFDNGWLWVIP